MMDSLLPLPLAISHFLDAIILAKAYFTEMLDQISKHQVRITETAFNTSTTCRKELSPIASAFILTKRPCFLLVSLTYLSCDRQLLRQEWIYQKANKQR